MGAEASQTTLLGTSTGSRWAIPGKSLPDLRNNPRPEGPQEPAPPPGQGMRPQEPGSVHCLWEKHDGQRHEHPQTQPALQERGESEGHCAVCLAPGTELQRPPAARQRLSSGRYSQHISDISTQLREVLFRVPRLPPLPIHLSVIFNFNTKTKR